MDPNTERYYRVLNLEPTATPEEVYRAYRDLVRVWDPQRFGNQPHLELMAEDKLKEIIEAYHALAGSPEIGELPAPSDGHGAPIPVADHNLPAAVVPREPVLAVEPGGWPAAPPEIVRAPEPQRPAGAFRSAGAPPAIPEPATPPPVVAEPPPPRSRGLLRAATQFAVFLIPVALVGAGLYLYDSSPARSERTGQSALPPGAAKSHVQSPVEPPSPAPRRLLRRIERPAPETQPGASTPLRTGAELMEPQGRKGAGKFRISNRTTLDAVIRVAEQRSPATPVRLVYVQAGTDVTIGGIPTGIYMVGVSMGSLDEPRSFKTILGPYQFLQIESEQGAQSDDYPIILKPKD
jgi:hypothetical protein